MVAASCQWICRAGRCERGSDALPPVEEEEEEAMPVELHCPITQMVMKKPAMATDGHSYELKAMQKWLLKKQTSRDSCTRPSCM